jgi:WD40 repeat protein
VSPNGKELVTGTYSILRYDTENGQRIAEIGTDMRNVYSMCYLSDTLMAIGNYNGSINIYNLESNKRVHKVEGNIIVLLIEHCLAIRQLAYDSVNKRLLTASDDLHINIIDLEGYKVIQTLVGHKDIITSLKCTERYYYSASVDGNIKVWDHRVAHKFGLVSNINLNIDNLWDIAVTGTESHIVAGGNNSCIILKYN